MPLSLSASRPASPLRPSSTGYDTRTRKTEHVLVARTFEGRTLAHPRASTHVVAVALSHTHTCPLSSPSSTTPTVSSSSSSSSSSSTATSVHLLRYLLHLHLQPPSLFRVRPFSASSRAPLLPRSRKPRTYGPRNRTPNIEPLSPTSPNAFRECGPSDISLPRRGPATLACLRASLHFQKPERQTLSLSLSPCLSSSLPLFASPSSHRRRPESGDSWLCSAAKHQCQIERAAINFPVAL